MIGHRQPESLSDVFEGVAKRAVPEIMEQGGGECLIGPWVLGTDVLINYSQQPSRGMEHTHAMEQPRVSRSGIDDVREPKLLDAPEPLEGSRLNDAPKHAFEMHPVDIEFDQVVKWIANSLLLRHAAESSSSQRCCIIEQKENTSMPRENYGTVLCSAYRGSPERPARASTTDLQLSVARGNPETPRAAPESILHAIGSVAHHRGRNDPGLAHD